MKTFTITLLCASFAAAQNVPSGFEKRCFNPEDPDDCVWVPASNSETNINTNGDPMLGEEDDEPGFKQMCFTNDPSSCVMVPAGGET